VSDVFYPVPEEQALAVLRTACDSPLNFLDTAAAYGNGESERRIGIVHVQHHRCLVAE
jgi:D-threo-aldose 1-dehydrogenase